MYFLEGLGFNFYLQGKNVSLSFFKLLLRFFNGHVRPTLQRYSTALCSNRVQWFSCLGSTLLKSWSPSNSGHHLSLWLACAWT